MEIKKVLHLFGAASIVLGCSSIDSNEPKKKKQQSVLMVSKTVMKGVQIKVSHPKHIKLIFKPLMV